jgi:hypothetical protein
MQALKDEKFLKKSNKFRDFLKKKDVDMKKPRFIKRIKKKLIKTLPSLEELLVEI